MRIDQSHSDIILHVSTEKYESWKELLRLFSEKETFLDAVTSSFYSLDQLISQLFWVVLVKNTTWLRRSSSLSSDQPLQIQSPLFLALKLKSQRGRDPGQTAGHSPSDPSTSSPYTGYYSGMQGQLGDQVIVDYPFITAMKRDRDSEWDSDHGVTRIWTTRAVQAEKLPR